MNRLSVPAMRRTMVVDKSTHVDISPAGSQFKSVSRDAYVLSLSAKWGEKCHDYNHTGIVCNKQESRCFCGGGIQVLSHLK